MADHAETRKDQNVNFRMTEEPEQMLVQQRIATTLRIEERGAEVTVGQQHRDGASENRKRQQKQECRNENGPDEQRHLVQRHARGTHVEDGGDEVDRTEDGRSTSDVKRQNTEVHRGTRVAGVTR